MNTKTPGKDLQDKVKEVKVLHEDYLTRLKALQKKQDDIINRTIKSMEYKKISKIKENINSI